MTDYNFDGMEPATDYGVSYKINSCGVEVLIVFRLVG